MSCYHHLCMEERESLMLFFEQGKSIRQIANDLKRAPSTISRELRRNAEPLFLTTEFHNGNCHELILALKNIEC